MTDEERAAGRRRIISLAIQWGDDATHIIHPYDLRLAMDGRSYGLPSLLRGEMGSAWASRVRETLKSERLVTS